MWVLTQVLLKFNPTLRTQVWNQLFNTRCGASKKALVTDQLHLSSKKLRAALQTLKAAAMTDGVIHRFASMQKLEQNITDQRLLLQKVL